MTGELAGFTDPISVFGFMFVTTLGTPARCASFGAGEALYVGLLAFLGEVVDVLAVFPQGHALIVVSAAVLLTDTMRIADEEYPDLLFHTKVDHSAGSFVPQITNTTLCTTALLVLRSLQLLPAMGVLFASGLLLRNLAELLIALSFERTDTAPGHNHGLACIGCDDGQMNLAQVYGGIYIARSLLCLWYFYAHMQFKAIIPYQTASTALLWKGKCQDKGCTPFTHRQDYPSMLTTHRLSGPFDRVETFLAPGVLRLHLWMALAKFACGLDSGKKSLNHHLYRLAMERELSLRGFLQGITSGP
jgi:hypothetical protein